MATSTTNSKRLMKPRSPVVQSQNQIKGIKKVQHQETRHSDSSNGMRKIKVKGNRQPLNKKKFTGLGCKEFIVCLDDLGIVNEEKLDKQEKYHE